MTTEERIPSRTTRDQAESISEVRSYPGEDHLFRPLKVPIRLRNLLMQLLESLPPLTDRDTESLGNNFPDQKEPIGPRRKPTNTT